jgi:hypothetical protein
MSLYLGNLGTKEIQDRLGVSIPGLSDYMDGKRQENAGPLGKGKWHCFDVPFLINCADIETATAINEIMAPFSEQMNCKIQIAIDD